MMMMKTAYRSATLLLSLATSTAALLFILGAGFATGCVQNVNHVVVELSADGVDIANELDTIEVTITASRNSAGTELCIPHTITYTLDPADASRIDLPFELEISPGETFDKLVFLRVVGLHYGTVRYKSDRAASLGGGDSVVHVAITADCLGVGTGLGQHCQGGLATSSPYADIFDEHMFVNGEACVDSQ